MAKKLKYDYIVVEGNIGTGKLLLPDGYLPILIPG